ncbi:MAG: ABC transporter ATP-binding protein [Oscillospiraceae bacterium]|nr:ABC transporter ATP-binding protein [Oscillospiraceae bacterium]
MTTKDFREKSQLAIFLHYFKPHWKLFVLDLSCALLISLIDLAFPYVSRMAMYNWLPEKAFHTFFIVMAIVFGAFLLRSGLYYIVTCWGHTFGIRVEADIRRDLFAHMQTMSFRFFDNNRTGQLMSRITSDLFEITELSHHGPEDIFIASVTILGSLAVMFSIEWRLALVLTVLLPVFLAVLMKNRTRQRIASKEVKQRTGAINTEIESSLTGMRTAKAFANEEEELRKFTLANDEFKLSKRHFHRAMGIFFGSMEFFFCAMSAAVITVGGWLIMRGEMDYVDLLTFNLYITAFITPVRKLSNFMELFSSGTAGLSRFVELMRTEPDLQDAPDAEELRVEKGEICFNNVHFRYDRQAVLHGIDLTVQSGETVAVVGSSGGGKTTLCQLIPRFYDVESGSVTVDGHDVCHVTQRSLRRQIGIVQQDVFLFAGTIADNIRYGRMDATDEEVIAAAKRAEIYDDICRMPQGFQTYVGERGILLSGGQKQRVAIARIFLKNPPILILDEATSALDSVTESHIQSAFDELARGRTTLIIAHRLSTIRKADRIVVVQDGRITESGSHEELMKLGGAYSELYRTQTEIYG